MLEANEEDLTLTDGEFSVAGAPGGPTVGLAEVAFARVHRP